MLGHGMTPSEINSEGAEQGPLRTALHSREEELRWRVFQGANAVDRRAGGRSALGGDAKRHGARLLAPEPRPGDQSRRNIARPQRGPLWPLVAYGALVLVMLAMPDRPDDAKGRPETDPAKRRRSNPPMAGRRLIAHAQRSAVADGRRLLRGGFPGKAGRTSFGALIRR